MNAAVQWSMPAMLAADNLLPYLPEGPLEVFPKNRVIYSPQQPTNNIYAVVSGHVKILTHSRVGGGSIVGLLRPGGIFGEHCLVAKVPSEETAVAIDRLTVMA